MNPVAKKTKDISVLSALALALLASPAFALQAPAVAEKKAEGAETLSAEQVLEKYVEATGGKAAYEKLKSRRMTSNFELKGMPIKGTMEIVQKAPDFFFQSLTIPGMTEQHAGYDGKIAWSKDPMMGLRVLEGKELASRKVEAQFNAELRWREIYKEVKSLGRKTVDGKEVYEVELTPKEGNSTLARYDASTFLMISQTRTEESPQGKINATVFVSDYKEVDGIKIPFTIRMAVGPQEFIMKVQEVKHNEEFADAKFAKPEGEDD